MTFTMYLIVVLTAIVLLLLIYKYDMYDREPWYLILLALFLGGLSSWGIGFVEDWLIFQTDSGESIFGKSLIASTCEEACKVCVILIIAFVFSKHFNDPMDGIVYGALAGLGFGLEESRFYLELAPHSFPKPTKVELFGQESIRLLLHFLTGGLDGFGIGLVWFRIRQARRILVGWLFASLAIHFMWDYACGLPQDGGGFKQRGAAIALMLFALVLFGIAVVVGNLWSAATHPPRDGIPPLVRWPFTLLIRDQRKDSP